MVATNKIKLALIMGCTVLPTIVHAENIPERGLISFRYLDYKDSQPGLDRISIKAPSARVLLPFADEWVVEAGMVYDAVSGATPSYHSEKSSLTKLEDDREAKDIRVTRYFPRGTLSFSQSFSTENDYDSRAHSISGTYSSEDKNTTLNLGIGETRDNINVPLFDIINRKKTTIDMMIGVTQVLTPVDIVQLNVTGYNGHGFYSDPYKQGESTPGGRPNNKDGFAVLGRWNHHFADNGTTLKTSYRYYKDTFDIQSHTLASEWVIPYGAWSFTPSLRYYSQSAAYFYADPENAPLPTFNWSNDPYFSQDQRLSAFGARTLGIKVTRKIGTDWLLDVKYEDYEQRSDWALGKGSPGIDPFRAKSWQFGITHYL